MNGKAIAFGLSLGLAGFLTGCFQKTSVDTACEAMYTTSSVQYVGHAFGRGSLSLAAGEQAQEVVGQLVLRGESEDTPPMTLDAHGTCAHGVARLRIAGFDHPASPTRVLGGRLVVTDAPELFGHAFGMWRAEVVDKAKGKRQHMHGYLRERLDTEKVAQQ